jgi:hypothetical protein
MWKKRKVFNKSSPFSLHFCRCWGVLLSLSKRMNERSRLRRTRSQVKSVDIIVGFSCIISPFWTKKVSQPNSSCSQPFWLFFLLSYPTTKCTICVTSYTLVY